ASPAAAASAGWPWPSSASSPATCRRRSSSCATPASCTRSAACTTWRPWWRRPATSAASCGHAARCWGRGRRCSARRSRTGPWASRSARPPAAAGSRADRDSGLPRPSARPQGGPQLELACGDGHPVLLAEGLAALHTAAQGFPFGGGLRLLHPCAPARRQRQRAVLEQAALLLHAVPSAPRAAPAPAVGPLDQPGPQRVALHVAAAGQVVLVVLHREGLTDSLLVKENRCVPFSSRRRPRSRVPHTNR